MKTKPPNPRKPTLSAYNQAVQTAYMSILKVTKQLLAQFEQDELRFTLQRSNKTETTVGTVVHEFINPLFFLRLECYEGELFGIQYGFETIHTESEYSKAIALFTRYIYKVTSKERTKINIEDSVKTAYTIYTCFELYDYIEERNKHHTFTLIKHRVIPNQRKQMLSVA
jgi:hypothetical protein